MRLVSKCLFALTLVLALTSLPAAQPEAGGKLKMSSGYGKSFHRGGFRFGGKHSFRSFRHYRGFKHKKFFSKRSAFLRHGTRHRLKRSVYGRYGAKLASRRFSPIVPPFGSDARQLTFEGGRRDTFGHSGRRHGAYGYRDRRRAFGSQAGLSRNSPIVPTFGSDARHITFDGGRHRDIGHSGRGHRAYGYGDRRRSSGSQAGLRRNSPSGPPVGSDARHITFDGGRHRDFGHSGRRHGAYGYRDRRRGAFGSQAGLSRNSPIVPPFGSDARHITFDGGRHRAFGHSDRSRNAAFEHNGHREAAFEHNGYRDAAFEHNGYQDAAFELNGFRKAAFGRNGHRKAAFGSRAGPTETSPIVPPFGSGSPQLDFGGRRGSVLVLKGSQRSVVHRGEPKARGGQIVRVGHNDSPTLPVVQYGYSGD